MHTRTAALGIFVNLTVEQPLADVTALAHHGQKVVLEMLSAAGAVAEVDGDAAQRIDVIRQNIGLVGAPARPMPPTCR